MGLACCVPSSLDAPSTLYAKSLPEGIIHINAETDEKTFKRFIEVLSESFVGTTEHSPEPIISWVQDPEVSGGNSAAPLLQPPSEERKSYFAYLMELTALVGFRHGGCYALVDKSGNIVAATVTCPPHDTRKLYDIGFCEFMYLSNNHSGGAKMDILSTPRMQALEKTMATAHKECTSGKHLYIYAFGALPMEQGKGYGRRLMHFLLEAADYNNCPAYLETGGIKNVNFYSKNDFEVKHVYPIEVDGTKFDPDGIGGLSAMVRNPKNQGEIQTY